VDSALKKAGKLDEVNDKNKVQPKTAKVNISWADFKSKTI
jgi:hypothetical protein